MNGFERISDPNPCQNCGYVIIEGYKVLICPYCVRQYVRENKKIMFIIESI